MKKTVAALTVILIVITSIAQAQVTNDNTIPNDVELKSYTIAKYRLFETTNMWTFIKLDTQNGRMWQVQFDVEGSNRFATFLNEIPLVYKNEEVNNRFTLYSTQNMWNFILLDQINGKMWQVQWSQEPENRGIVRID